MRLGETIVTDEVQVVADYLAGAVLELYEGDALIVSVPFAKNAAAVSGGEVEFRGFAPAVATGSGTADAFRAVSDSVVVFEGTAGPDGELQLEPTYAIEEGDVVRVYSLTYVQPR